MRFSRMIDKSVAKQTDTAYMKEMFKDTHLNVGVIFVCTAESWRKEDYWIDRKDGNVYYKIRLPYEKVLGLEDATPLMLEFLNNRLKEIPPGSKPMKKSSSREKKAAKNDVATA